MLVPHTVGKSYRVPVQQLSDGVSNLSDGMSNSVQLGSQRGDGGGCVPSESLNLTMYITDELEPYRLDSAVDVSHRLDTDVYVSPPRKRVRVADCLPGRSLVDVCPVDPPVRRKQVPVHSKQERNKQEVRSSVHVCSASMSMDVEDCSDSHICSVHNNDKHEERFTCFLSRRSRLPLVRACSCHRVHVCGRVEGYVPRVTVDTASDVPCSAFPFIERHPVLKNEPIHPIPHAAITLKAANGSSMELKGFIRFDLEWGDVNRSVEALVISSLCPDDILLDNSVMFLLGAKLDWKNQCLTFHSSNVTIPAVHRVDKCYRAHTISSPSPASVSVASVRADFEAAPVSLKARFYLPAGTEASVLAFTSNSSCRH